MKKKEQKSKKNKKTKIINDNTKQLEKENNVENDINTTMEEAKEDKEWIKKLVKELDNFSLGSSNGIWKNFRNEKVFSFISR